MFKYYILYNLIYLIYFRKYIYYYINNIYFNTVTVFRVAIREMITPLYQYQNERLPFIRQIILILTLRIQQR